MSFLLSYYSHLFLQVALITDLLTTWKSSFDSQLYSLLCLRRQNARIIVRNPHDYLNTQTNFITTAIAADFATINVGDSMDVSTPLISIHFHHRQMVQWSFPYYLYFPALLKMSFISAIIAIIIVDALTTTAIALHFAE